MSLQVKGFHHYIDIQSDKNLKNCFRLKLQNNLMNLVVKKLK